MSSDLKALGGAKKASVNGLELKFAVGNVGQSDAYFKVIDISQIIPQFLYFTLCLLILIRLIAPS